MVTIVEIPPLSDVDDPNGWAVLAVNGLWSAELRRVFGYDDLNNSDTAALRVAVPSSRTRRQRWVAMLDPSDRDSLVGAASVTFALLDNTDVPTFDVIVAPEQRRRGIDPLEADAVAHCAGYRLVTWQGGCPDEYVDDFAKLRVAMVDAPSAGMDISEEHWDADAIREIEQRVREAGYVTMTTAAQHEASGELVGFTRCSA